MIYFTKYANQKFDILHKYKVFYTKEQVEDCVKFPEKMGKKNKYHTATKDNIKVIYKLDKGTVRIITFYPIKL